MVVPVGDPWHLRSAVSLKMLAQRPLIAMPVGTGLRRRLDDACAAAGIAVRVAYEAGTPAALAELARHGLGPAIVPASLSGSRPDLRAIPIAPEVRGRLALAWRSSGPINPAARALIDLAREHVRVGGRA